MAALPCEETLCGQCLVHRPAPTAADLLPPPAGQPRASRGALGAPAPLRARLAAALPVPSEAHARRAAAGERHPRAAAHIRALAWRGGEPRRRGRPGPARLPSAARRRWPGPRAAAACAGRVRVAGLGLRAAAGAPAAPPADGLCRAPGAAGCVGHWPRGLCTDVPLPQGQRPSGVPGSGAGVGGGCCKGAAGQTEGLSLGPWHAEQRGPSQPAPPSRAER
mmetsp:Transcript_96224/g.299060  ORF Transcript_96224/g.299060 Transcript_96224/m.299060 type:complete len:221 (+) Transcript_96224:2151-2813(+)